MKNKLSRSDVYDINKKTGGLILGKNRLEDYATKFLNKVCKKALETPMALPIDEILEYYRLTIKEVSLSRNLDIFGCCMLLDGNVEIFDKGRGTSVRVRYPAGTILLDEDYLERYGEGAKRNTLIHEILHWEKDRQYFRILEFNHQAQSEEFSPIMCRQSETFYKPPKGKKTKENEVKWLEWQAHRLAPRVLMPFEMFKQKTLELIAGYQNLKKDSMLSCDTLIEDLSEFFIVSRVSVKYRLIEVGLLERLRNYYDFDEVFSEINENNNLVALTPIEAYQLLTADSSLREWVSGGRFVYADGYFVLAASQYIVIKEGELHLTSKAKKNLAQCAINIREQKYIEYRNVSKDFLGFAVLHRVEGIDKRILTFHPKFQTNFIYEPDDAYRAFHNYISEYDEEVEMELMKRLGDPKNELCQILWYLMENRKWNYPEVFFEKTGLNKNYHGKIKNNKYNNMGTSVLMTICVGLKLSLRITEKIFERSKNKLDYYHDPDKTYIRILENMPGISVQDFNSICEHAGVKKLGSTIRDNE